MRRAELRASEGAIFSLLPLFPSTLEGLGLLISAILFILLIGSVTRRRLEARHRRLADERYASLFENNADAVVAVDSSGAIEDANPAFSLLSGYALEELAGVAFASLVPPADRGKILKGLDRVRRSGPRTQETSLIHKKGREIEVELMTVPIQVDEEIVGAYQIARDLTERRQLEERLEERALHDYLTNLPNRALFTDRLEHALQRVRRHGGRVALLYLDLDGFKTVNDTEGHEAGDQLLVEVASRLRCFMREGDTVARLGGDEFAVLLEDVVDEEEATAAAERVVELVSQPFPIEEREAHVGASVGVSVSRPETDGPSEIVRQADIAMYEAKRRGGYRFQLYTQELETARPTDSLHLKSDLKQAIEDEELMLHYQPIVDLAGTRIVGVEALVRWRHPVHGMIPPSSFIPLAENADLIVGLDHWVLERSCQDIQRLMTRGVIRGQSFFLSVNLSSRHFQDDDLIDEVFAVLETAKLAAEYLQLEITERAVVQGSKRISRLKKLGLKVAIDDFGTGRTSLAYLQSLDVDVLKVDRSFVKTLGADPASTAAIRTILTLAEMLRLDVIIEGIEDPVQLQTLQDMGGRLVQGFYFGAAVALDELEKLLRRGLPPAWIYRPGSGVGLPTSEQAPKLRPIARG